MAESNTNSTSNNSLLANLGTWFGGLAGGGEAQSLIQPSTGETNFDLSSLIGGCFGGGKPTPVNSVPKETEATENKPKTEEKPPLLNSALQALSALNTSSGSAKNASAATAMKMIYQPTPTTFVQYIPPQKKRIAPLSGKK